MSQTLREHPHLFKALSLEVEGKASISGICDRVEVKPGFWRDIRTGERLPGRSIRFRIRVDVGRTRWTPWYRDEAKG